MKLSKIAICQGLHVVCPTIKRTTLLSLIGLQSSPRHGHIDARYFYQSDTEHVKPWSQRSTEEQEAAIKAARELIEETLLRNGDQPLPSGNQDVTTAPKD